MVVNLTYSKRFRKSFEKRILPHLQLQKKFDERIVFFIRNPSHPLLHDHALKGNKAGKRAFSITGDIRVVYRYIDEKTILFLDIGSHNQVY